MIKRLETAVQTALADNDDPEIFLNAKARHTVVRAILQAMREPTEDALEATGYPTSAEHCWKAMIDHLLAEGPETIK